MFVLNTLNGFKHFENIVLIDDNDPYNIAENIIKLLKDEELRKTIGRNGTKFVSDRMDLRIVEENLSKIYSDTIEEFAK